MIKPPFFLVIQSTYEQVEYALFSGHNCLYVVTINKKKATETLIPSIQTTLCKAGLDLANLSFIGANTGPAPFTTLRVVIASINGISFASGTPLIGVNGINALFDQYYQEPFVTIALLNAFNKEVYYALGQQEEISYGCLSINNLIKKIHANYKGLPLQFIGNGTQLYLDQLAHAFPEYTTLIRQDIAFCSLETIAKKALKKWNDNKPTKTTLAPLYLKKV